MFKSLRISLICVLLAGSVIIWLISSCSHKVDNLPARITQTVMSRQLKLDESDDMLYTAITVRRDNKVLYVYGFHDVKEISADSLKEISSTALPNGMIYDLAISPDGRQIVLADYSGSLITASVNPLKIIRKTSVHGKPMHVIYHPGGDRIYYTSPQDGTVGYISSDGKGESNYAVTGNSPAGIALSLESLYVGHDDAYVVNEYDPDNLKLRRKIQLWSKSSTVRTSSEGLMNFGASEICLYGKFLYAQSPIDSRIWKVELGTGETRDIKIGYGTSSLKVVHDGSLVSPGDIWSRVEGKPTSVIDVNTFKVDELLQTRNSSDNISRCWNATMNPSGDRLYTICSAYSGTYLQERRRVKED